jgi:hypothetical protein
MVPAYSITRPGIFHNLPAPNTTLMVNMLPTNVAIDFLPILR